MRNDRRRSRLSLIAVAVATAAAMGVAAIVAGTTSPSPLHEHDDDARGELPPAPCVLLARGGPPRGEPLAVGVADAPSGGDVVDARSDVVTASDTTFVFVDAETGRPIPETDFTFAKTLRGSSTRAGWLCAALFDGGRHVTVEPLGLDRPRPPAMRCATTVVPVLRRIDVNVRLDPGAGDRPVPVSVATSAQPPLSTHAWGGSTTFSVAFHPGEPVWVAAGGEGARSTTSILLPDVWLPTVDVAARKWEPIPPVFVEADEFDADVDFSRPPETTIRIAATRRDGSPARCARIVVDGKEHVTDADGRLALGVFAESTVTVALADPSLTPVTAIVAPRPFGVVDVALREPEPAALDAVVTFPDGRPVPFAVLAVATPSGVEPADVVDGVFRTDRHADVNGRRSWPRVEPAVVTVRASWGARSATVDCTLLPGVRSNVRLVLEPAATRPTSIDSPPRWCVK